MIRKSPTLALLFAAGAGALYGMLGRWVFSSDTGGSLFGAMSMAFVFLVPFAIGYLTLAVAPDHYLRKTAARVLLPWLSVLLAVFGVWVTGWEGKICVIMLLPVLLPMSNLGGAMAMQLRRRQVGRRLYATSLGSMLLLPYIAAPVEGAIAPNDQLRVVETSVRIRATPGAVWRQIVKVPRIGPDEYGTSLVHRIGFPRPVEATLSHEGVGGVRRASFERGVVFIETVTTWRPDSLLSFTIHADPSTIPPTALDEHVTIGGEHFDVLDGTYAIEPVAPGEVILHLSSTHRLSTRFNFYASLWSDLVMRQIQGNILQVVKHRAESAG
ncbi:MAG TPA: hypothetical protein VFJ16_02280 [Longimicrobium sp.]|nr:hypothetical protein [Longimicrobium sp.]